MMTSPQTKRPTFHTLLLGGLTALLVTATAGMAHAGAAVGDRAPEFALTDLDGKKHSLADYKGKVVVLEWTNPKCPFVVRHTKEKTMTTLRAKYPEVVWLAINSTREDHPEYVSPKDMKGLAKDNGITYPVLYDADGATGKAYGARTTPHMFVIGKDGVVAYNGAIDDDPSGRNEQSKRKALVDLAIAAAQKGQPVAESSSKPYGCGVKYKS